MRQSVIQGCVTTEIAPGFHLHDLNAPPAGKTKSSSCLLFLSKNSLSIFLRSIMQLFSSIQTAKIQLFSNLLECIMQLFSDRAVFHLKPLFFPADFPDESKKMVETVWKSTLSNIIQPIFSNFDNDCATGISPSIPPMERDCQAFRRCTGG